MAQRRRKVGSGRSARSESVSSKPIPPTSDFSIHSPIEFTRWLARALLLGMVAVAPWYYAFATWESQFWLVIASGILLLLSLLSAEREPGGGILHRCLAVVIIVVFLQTIPLPDSLYQLLSANASFESEVAELSKDFNTDFSPSQVENAEVLIEEIEFPQSVSVAPGQTRAALCVLGCALAVLWSSSLIMGSLRWQLLLLAVISISGLANASLGILQSLSDWTLLNLEGRYFATFVNRNSAPQFYATCLGATLAIIVWWFSSKGSVSRKYNVHYPAVNIMARLRRRIESLVSELDVALSLLLVAIVIVFTAIFATASRGGILACSVASLIVMIRLLADYRASFLAIVVLGGSLVSVLLLSVLGIGTEASDRLSTLSEEFHQLSNPRIALWSEVLSRGECWLLGSGYGTFHLAVLDCDLALSSSAWYYHGENLYVEMIVTMGIFVFLLIAISLGLFVYELMSDAQGKRFLHIAALPAVCAIAVQSMVDFSLILPGIFLPLLAVIGALRPSEAPPVWGRISFPERLGACLLTLAALAFGLPELNDLAQAEVLARNSGQPLTSTSQFEVARQEQLEFRSFVLNSAPWPENLDEEAKRYLSRPEFFLAAIRNPGDDLAFLYEFADQNQDSLNYLRTTATPMAATLSGAPLDWRASWGLLRADLGTLSDSERARNLARLYLTSAHKPELLADIGSFLLWSKDKELGLKFWRKAIRKDPTYIKNAIRLLPAAIDGEDLLFMLPDNALVQISTALQIEQSGQPENAQLMLDAISFPDAEAMATDSADWQFVGTLAERRGLLPEAAEAFLTAANKDATNHGLRYKAAKALLNAGQLDQAWEEIDRALRRSPKNRDYEAVKQSIRDKRKENQES